MSHEPVTMNNRLINKSFQQLIYFTPSALCVAFVVAPGGFVLRKATFVCFEVTQEEADNTIKKTRTKKIKVCFMIPSSTSLSNPYVHETI